MGRVGRKGKGMMCPQMWFNSQISLVPRHPFPLWQRVWERDYSQVRSLHSVWFSATCLVSRSGGGRGQEEELGGSGEGLQSACSVVKPLAVYYTPCKWLSTFVQVAMWATEAFFRYGGEPHFIFPTTVGPASQILGGASPATPNMTQYASSYPSPAPTSSSLAAPHVVGPLSSMATPPHPHPPPLTALSPATPLQYSTPGSLGRALLGPEVQLSGKHNGLCRYMARILWWVGTRFADESLCLLYGYECVSRSVLVVSHVVN